MNPNELSEMKKEVAESLRQIEALRLSMRRNLAKLVQWEKRIQADTTESARARRTVVEKAHRKDTEHESFTPEERVGRALESIRDTFTRAELLREAERHGSSTIAVGRYRAIFRDLMRTRRIECVEGKPTQPDSRFAKTEVQKPGEFS